MSQGLMKYKRVVMRLREKFKETAFNNKELEEAIFEECGTDPRTINRAKDTLLRMKLMEKVQEEREFGRPYEEKYKLPPSQNEYF